MGRPPKKRAKAQDIPWEKAIRTVLDQVDGALHYADIAERIVGNGYRKSVGATPAATVSSILSTSVRDPASPYIKVGRGEYALRVAPERGASDAVFSKRNAEEAGALRSFGMYWQRGLIFWTGSPKILGRQGAGATEVNFAEQVGVYLLHDRERVIYVGRAEDTLFSRLKAHTADRLGGRWDRFSWFGLRDVQPSGSLSESVVPWTQDVVVSTMEAVLIESLEPPLNRRRGDNLSSVEYIQAQDPRVVDPAKQALIQQIMSARVG